MAYGIKVTKEGYGAGTASARYFSLNTDQNIFKVKSNGIGTVNASTIATVAHNLSYKPNFMVYIQDVADANSMNLVSAGMVANEAVVSCGTTNLLLNNMNASTNRRYYYYIMHDPI